MQAPALVQLFGGGLGAVGVQAVAEVPGEQAQAQGVELAGCREEEGLGLPQRLQAHLLGAAAELGGMREGDLAGGEGGGGLGQLGQAARHLHLLGGGVGGEPALRAQPGGGAEGALGGVGAGALEVAELGREDRAQGLHEAVQLHQLGAGQAAGRALRGLRAQLLDCLAEEVEAGRLWQTHVRCPA